MVISIVMKCNMNEILLLLCNKITLTVMDNLKTHLNYTKWAHHTV